MSQVSKYPLIVKEYHHTQVLIWLILTRYWGHCWPLLMLISAYSLPACTWRFKILICRHLIKPAVFACPVHSWLTWSRLQPNHQGLSTVCCVCRCLCYVRGFARLHRGWRDRPKTKSSNAESLSYFPFFYPLIWTMQDRAVLYFHFRWSWITVFKPLACDGTVSFQARFQAVALLAKHKSWADSY